MVVYHHRALPLPATARDARCTPAVHATTLSHPCTRQSTAAAGATPSCTRLQPGSTSTALLAPPAAGPETALLGRRGRAPMTAASKGLLHSAHSVTDLAALVAQAPCRGPPSCTAAETRAALSRVRCSRCPTAAKSLNALTPAACGPLCVSSHRSTLRNNISSAQYSFLLRAPDH